MDNSISNIGTRYSVRQVNQHYICRKFSILVKFIKKKVCIVLKVQNVLPAKTNAVKVIFYIIRKK